MFFDLILMHYTPITIFFFIDIKNNPAPKAISYSNYNVLDVFIGMIHWIYNNGPMG